MLESRDAIQTLEDQDKLFQVCKPCQLCKRHISNAGECACTWKPSTGTLAQVGKSWNTPGQLSHNISLDLRMNHTNKKLKKCSEALEQMFLKDYLFNDEGINTGLPY